MFILIKELGNRILKLWTLGKKLNSGVDITLIVSIDYSSAYVISLSYIERCLDGVVMLTLCYYIYDCSFQNKYTRPTSCTRCHHKQVLLR